MNKLDINQIKIEDYDEVEPERYALYYSEDTMLIRHGSYMPHYFVRKQSVGTKEQIQTKMEKQYEILRKQLQILLASENTSVENIREIVSAFVILRNKYSMVYNEELDTLIKNFSAFLSTKQRIEQENL